MRKTFIFILGLAFLSSCQENTIELKFYGQLMGEVLESGTLAPIPGVTLTTNPETDFIVSDEFGEFVVDSLLEGTYSVRARKEGYTDGVISVQIDGERITSVKILMSKNTEANSPPALPGVPLPANGAGGQEPELTLSWSGSDPDGDTLSYDVYLFSSDTSMAIPIALATTDTFVTVSSMGFSKMYYWQVVANDNINPPVYGEVWSFSIRDFPSNDYRYTFVRPVNSTFTLFAGNEPLEDAERSYQLTDGMKAYWRPKLRPQLRDDMAALYLKGAEVHIALMGRDGENPRQVTAAIPLRSKSEIDASYCWSPNGDKLLYMNFGNLYQINPDGSGLAYVASADPGYLFTAVDWTLYDNNTIVAAAERPDSRQSRLYLFRMGEPAVSILDSTLLGQIRHPTFSPSGKMIAFSFNSNSNFSADGQPLNSQILAYNTETGALINLSFNKEPGTNDMQPRFTQGGAKILFVNRDTDNIDPPLVMVMDVLTTSNQRRTLLFSNADMPDWN